MAIDFNSTDIQQAMELLFSLVKKTDPDMDNLRASFSEKLLSSLPFLCANGMLPNEIMNKDVQEKFIDILTSEYKQRVGVKLKKGILLGNMGHTPWLKPEDFSWESWSRYRLYLSTKQGFTEENLKTLDEISNTIIDRMGNPKSDSAYQTKGLLMGDVQSGKTATYTGICHKALDVGYRFLIILSGTKETLRIQTQERLNADLMGFKVKTDETKRKTKDQGKQVPAGVGLVGSSEVNKLFHWNPITNLQQDFNSQMMGSTVSPHNSSEVIVFITKKNARILENIRKWLDTVSGMNVKNIPCLIIDDEADAASINTKKPELDPTAVNAAIRSILQYFEKSAYLAVTATPFANIFIDPQIPTKGDIPPEDILPDLFPSDYIYPLPPPDGYLGVERLFGELGELETKSTKYGAIIPLEAEEDLDSDEDLSSPSNSIAKGSLKKSTIIDELPPSLKKSILYFMCACTYLDIKSPKSRNTSMLVHVARYKLLHQQLQDRIDQYIDEIRNFAKAYGKRAADYVNNHPIYMQLEELWDNGCGTELWYTDPTKGERPATFRELSGFVWSDVWKSRFSLALETLQTIKVNSDSKRDQESISRLYEHKNARVIVIGGDALSRGLTLEGLCVTYFSRKSGMYDTLLQMGRWFGYRGEDEQFMKIWVTSGLISAFGYIADAVCEFRDTLELMKEQNRTPSDFGLRVRRAPAVAKLLVTARNKMYSAKRIKLLVNIAGGIYQAAHLPFNADKRKANVEMLNTFLHALPPPKLQGEINPNVSKATLNDIVFENVPALKTADLIENFNTFGWSQGLEGLHIAKYIREAIPEKTWTVRIISLSDKADSTQEKDAFGFGYDIVKPSRTLLQKSLWIQPANASVLTPDHLVRHWEEGRLQEEKKKNSNDSVQSIVKKTAGENPQLLIYDMVQNNKKEKSDMFKDDGTPVIALVLCIPNFEGRVKETIVEYDSNRIDQILAIDGFYQEEEEIDGED